MPNHPDLEPIQNKSREEFLRLTTENERLKREAKAHVVQSVANWANEAATELAVSKKLLLGLGIANSNGGKQLTR
jgi:hypothetical protein